MRGRSGKTLLIMCTLLLRLSYIRYFCSSSNSLTVEYCKAHPPPLHVAMAFIRIFTLTSVPRLLQYVDAKQKNCRINITICLYLFMLSTVLPSLPERTPLLLGEQIYEDAGAGPASMPVDAHAGELTPWEEQARERSGGEKLSVSPSACNIINNKSSFSQSLSHFLPSSLPLFLV